MFVCIILLMSSPMCRRLEHDTESLWSGQNLLFDIFIQSLSQLEIQVQKMAENDSK